MKLFQDVLYTIETIIEKDGDMWRVKWVGYPAEQVSITCCMHSFFKMKCIHITDWEKFVFPSHGIIRLASPSFNSILLFPYKATWETADSLPALVRQFFAKNANLGKPLPNPRVKSTEKTTEGQ